MARLNLYRLIPALLFIPSPVLAASGIEVDELNQLLELLQQQTSIATQTQLNSDYVPGMVSIMTGDEMRQRGFETLWDALAFLPGVQLDMDASGKRKLIVRGVGKSSETLKIKIQLNGVSLNQSISAASATLFDTPVNQIEKIEFVRGPGSAIHGEYALMGVLNVITLKQGKSITAGVDSNNGAQVSALYQFGETTDKLSGSFNIAVMNSDGEEIRTGDDRTSLPAKGYAPGPINNKTDSVSAILDLSVAGIDVNLQYQQSNRGDFYGVLNYLPAPVKQTVVSDTMYSLRLGKDFQISEQLSTQLSLTQLVNSTEKNSLFLGVAQLYGGLSSDDDIVSDVDQQEQRTTLALNLQYEFDAHTIFSEISASRISVDTATQYINLNPITHLPDSMMNTFPSPVHEGDRRDIKSLVLQDEYAINDVTTLTAGLRYDDVNNEYNNVSPRLALVWILSPSHILKLQYSEAFRPPSLRELGGSTGAEIIPETNETTEASYIYNSADTVVKNTFFYSEIQDYISYRNSTPFGYVNIAGAELSGYEFEVLHDLTADIQLNANLTLQQTKDRTSGQELYGSTPIIFTVSSNIKINPEMGINIQLKSLSERIRESGDSRPDLETMNQVDITLTRNNLFNREGLNLRTGVRNIFQEKIKYLSPMDTYAEDYVVNEDAIFWLEMNYHWQ